MNKESNLISVIIPTFNSEEFLSACLDSVINQDYYPLEIIVIDGHSSDSTLTILNKYKTIKTFESKKGVSAQRNLGILKSHGDYIFFMDSDDTIEKGFFKNLHSCMVEKNLDIVTPEIYENYYKNGKKISTHPFNGKYESLITKDNFFNNGYDSYNHGPYMLYKKSIIGNVFFDESLSYGEDSNFNYNILKNNDIKFGKCTNAIYNYRINLEQNPASKRLNKSTLTFFPSMINQIKKLNKESPNYLGAMSILEKNYWLFLNEYLKQKKPIPFAIYKTGLFISKTKNLIRKLKYFCPHIYRIYNTIQG